MTVSKARGAKRKADRLFSYIVRARGACENCGLTDYAQLQTAHIISRRYSGTRCDLDNAFCLCAKCHRYFTDHPLSFALFCKLNREEAMLDLLEERARPGTKVDWDEIAADLDARWKAMS